MASSTASAADLCGASPSKRVVCRMKMGGEFLDSADTRGPCRVAMQQSSLPKCRCPSSAKAWPRLLAASLCGPSDIKLHTGLCLSGENPRARFPTPTRRRAGRATWALGLMSQGSCATLRGSPGHVFASPPVKKPPAACSIGRAPPRPPPPPPTSAAQVFNGEGLMGLNVECYKLTSREMR